MGDWGWIDGGQARLREELAREAAKVKQQGGGPDERDCFHADDTTVPRLFLVGRVGTREGEDDPKRHDDGPQGLRPGMGEGLGWAS